MNQGTTIIKDIFALHYQYLFSQLGGFNCLQNCRNNNCSNKEFYYLPTGKEKNTVQKE